MTARWLSFALQPLLRPLPPRDFRRQLAPLLSTISAYDASRRKLETEGGGLADVQAITLELERPVVFKGRWAGSRGRLVDRDLQAKVAAHIDGDVHLQVRLLESGFPAYYVCRLGWDWFSTYGLVVEDLYVSPGYPLEDGRFVRLMRGGRERYCLRLSTLREGAARVLSTDPVEDDRVDALLYRVGRYVLEAAWHEDQRLVVRIAERFSLGRFLNTVELLYLTLSADLCGLRAAIDEPMLRVFTDVYPQPAIHEFLVRLPESDGAGLGRLAQAAPGLYQRLTAAFSRFLRVNVDWRGAQVPLYKLVLGNLSRLDLVARRLTQPSEVQAAIRRLDSESAKVIAGVMDGLAAQSPTIRGGGDSLARTGGPA